MVEMDDPCFLVEQIQPRVEGGVSFDVTEGSWELEAARFIFVSEKSCDFVSPHFFEGIVMEIGLGNPFFVGGGEASYGCGEVDVDIAFEVSAERMNSEKHARNETHLAGEFFDNSGSDGWDFVHKMAVHPEEIPESRWHGKRDVLPFGVGERVEAVFDPVISGPFSAGRAESGFAGMGRLEGFVALGADIEVVTEETCFTGHDF